MSDEALSVQLTRLARQPIPGVLAILGCAERARRMEAELEARNKQVDELIGAVQELRGEEPKVKGGKR